MNMLWNTDDEMNRYDEADLLAGITSPEMISDAKSVFNTNTGQTDLLAPLPSGGFVKLASQAPNVMVESPTMPGMVEPLPVEGPLARAAERTAAESQSKRRPMQLSPNTNTGQTGFFDNATSEIGKGLIRGAIVEPANFLKDNFGLYDPLVVQLVDPVTGEFDFDIKILSREEKADLDARMAAGEMPYAISLDELVASDETAGTGSQAIGGMAQFVGAFAGVGKLFKVGQGFKAGMTQGAAADFLGFDGSDAGITDLLLGFGVPDAMLPDFLEKDPNDPDYIGRLQAAFEGAFIGGAIEKLIPLVGKVFRSIKDGDVPAEVVTQSISDGKEAMRQALVSAGENAQTRITERGTGTTMMSGVDPTVITDPLVAAAGRAVSVPPPIKRNPVVDDLPMVDPDSLVGMKIFPIQADLTKAGGEYTGIDSSLIDVPIALQGGPDYPLLETSRAGNVVWANDAKGVSSKKLNKDTEYALVVAMSPDSHKTNATVSRAMLDTTLAYVRDGRLSDEAISQIDAAIQAPSTQKQLSSMGAFPGLKSPDAVDWINSATFEERNRIMQVMSSPGVQDLGAPNLQKILDATADPRYVGLNSNDSIMLIEIDKSGGAVKLGEAENTVPHLSYEYGLKGKPVARVPFTAAQNMFPEWFADRTVKETQMIREGTASDGSALPLKPLNQASPDVEVQGPPVPAQGPLQPVRGKPPNTARSFQFNLPVERITQSAADNMKAVAMQKVKSPLQAKLLVNALDGAWQTTAQSKNSGGITGLDWVKEAKASPDSATLTIPAGDNKAAAKALDQEIKSGQLTLYKLKDSRTYFGINKNYNYYEEYGLAPDADHWSPNPNGPTLNQNETALVSVVSNDFGAKGVGATTVMKAIEEGATVLDAFAVNSDKYPSGFLPAFYARFGFKEAGRIRFDPSMVLKEQGGKIKLQDMKASWAKKGWKEGDGYPDIVVMKWTGDEGGRSQYTRRFIAEAADGSGQGEATGLFRPTARSDGSNAGGSPTGQASPGDGDGTAGNVRNDNRGSSASQLADIGREILNATDAQLKNLGIDPQRVRRLRNEMALD